MARSITIYAYFFVQIVTYVKRFEISRQEIASKALVYKTTYQFISIVLAVLTDF